MSLSRGLRATSDRGTALRLTQRHAAVALVASAVLALVAGGCASLGKPGMAGSVDFVDGSGREGTLAAFAGKVVVLDLCASWATACNINAKVLDEVALALAEKKRDGQVEVVLITVLLDEGEMGRVAMQSYADTLGVKHPVFMASSRVRAGTSILGPAGYVPRIVLFDREGRVRFDDSGGVINVEGLLAKVEPLL